MTYTSERRDDDRPTNKPPSETLWDFGKPWWSDYDTERLLSVWADIVRVIEAAEKRPDADTAIRLGQLEKALSR